MPVSSYLMKKRINSITSFTRNTLKKIKNKRSLDKANIHELVNPFTLTAVNIAAEKGKQYNSKTEKEVINELTNDVIAIGTVL
jgi:hypothetical protein